MARPNRIERQIADRGVSEPLRSRYPDFAGLLAAGEDEEMSTACARRKPSAAR